MEVVYFLLGICYIFDNFNILVVLFFLFGLKLYVPINSFSVMSRQFSWGEPVLSNEDAVPCSRTQHRTVLRKKN